MRVDARTRTVTASAAAPAGVGNRFAVDPGAGRLWLWFCADGHCAARAYDLATLAAVRDVPIPPQEIFQAVAVAGDLWVAAGPLYRIAATASAAQQVPGVDAFGLAADPQRGRILAVGMSGAGGVAAVDTTTLAVTRGSGLDLGKASVAVVSGQVWVGGYGSTDTPRLVRLDPRTLRPAGSSPVDGQLGPGAVVWPGGSVLWVRDGGDEGLSCLRPGDGAILRQWREVQGPVASVPGTAVAAHNGAALWLSLDAACRG